MTQLEAALYIVTVVTLLYNIRGLLKGAKRFKQKNENAHVGRNFITLLAAALAEALVIWGIYTLYEHFNALQTGYTASLVVFAIALILRNGGSYLAVNIVWTIFIRIDRKKVIEEIRGG